MSIQSTQFKAKAQTIVEFALMLPVVLVMLYGVIEFSRYMQAYLTVQHAAREGVRYAVTGRSITGLPADRPQSIVQRAREAAAGLPVTNGTDSPAYEANPAIPGQLDIYLNPQDGVNPDTRPQPFTPEPLTVTVTYNYEPIVPVNFNIVGNVISVIPPILTVVGQATMIVERIDRVTPVAEGTLAATQGSTPQDTPTPGPTFTAGPSPTITNTPTITSTLVNTYTPTITQTASITPTGSPTPPCNISASSLSVSNDKITTSLTNSMGIDVVITQIYVEWPSGNVKLKEIKLAGQKIAKPDDTSSPTTVSGGWQGSVSDRTITASSSANMEIKFEHKPIEASPYLVTVTFDNGCSVNTSIGVSTSTVTPTPTITRTPTITPTPSITPTVTQTPTITATSACNLSAGSITFNGKKMQMSITNNSSQTVTISSIVVVWNSSAKELKKVKLSGTTIWDKKTKNNPAVISSNWKGSSNDRSISAGSSKTMKIEFEKDITSGSISVNFTNGCHVP